MNKKFAYGLIIGTLSLGAIPCYANTRNMVDVNTHRGYEIQRKLADLTDQKVEQKSFANLTLQDQEQRSGDEIEITKTVNGPSAGLDNHTVEGNTIDDKSLQELSQLSGDDPNLNPGQGSGIDLTVQRVEESLLDDAYLDKEKQRSVGEVDLDIKDQPSTVGSTDQKPERSSIDVSLQEEPNCQVYDMNLSKADESSGDNGGSHNPVLDRKEAVN